ncbi:divergent polysaccharide deacetylase family protein [Shewanella sp. 202IG2-18]|uniref:divergent polysaccharide deacetylase family protein n=1 Tax=Parashewanella hymeniacidonis TaxID=2807618 RepID=UPI00195F4AC8|nr:divergent polysaccharide deacetylase family protein [Parashewanella hymeniacidonis]MBM7074101.1 divergent polysaccharide deacetylase family protein [Parashewanella hymeniacidonis]
MEYLRRLQLASLLVLAFVCGLSEAAQVALIIDDIGYKKTDHQVLALPTNVTLSVLPFTPLGQRIADKANQQGHEVMLHIPMQSLQGNRLGKGGLNNDMDEAELTGILEQALADIPYAKGLNNHMGSLLTQLPRPMHWTMATLQKHRLFFIDSSTTKYTVARDIAQQYQVPHIKRHVFLDNNLDPKSLESQFKHLLWLAKKRKSTVAIAHPHKETLRFLVANLDRLKQAGIELVPASEMFKTIPNNTGFQNVISIKKQ